jgi:hypothetical protein
MRRSIAAFAVLMLIFGVVARADSLESTLGSDGEVYLSKVGTYSELFPGTAALAGDPQVLALEILRPGDEPEWLLVPESEGVGSETSRFVLFEDGSETVFVVWEGRVGSHPMIKLAYYQGGAWSEVFRISENVWTWKGYPQLAISRDSFEIEAEDGSIRQIQRTLLHVVWWEETVEGYQTLYRPLVLEDGHLLGLGPVLPLNELAGDELAEGGEAPTVGLLRRPVLEVNENGRNMTVAFADPVTRKLLVLDIGLLPAGLGLLGEDTHEFIAHLDLGPRPDIDSIAGVIRAHIDIGGSRYRLNPRLIRSLAEEVHSRIVEDFPSLTPGDLDSMAGVIRAHIDIGGARLSHETLDRFDQAVSTSVMRISPETDLLLSSTSEGEIPHLVRLTLTAELPVPALADGAAGEIGETHVFCSQNGQRAVVAWDEGARLRYRELVDGAWSEARAMDVGGELSRNEALAIIHQRVLLSR